MRKQTRIGGMPTLRGARKRRLTYPAHALSVIYSLAWLPAQTQNATRSGKDLVKNICAECHGTGKDNAPKMSDREAWVQRIVKHVGIEQLVRSAIRGHGGMPARGDQADITDNEFQSAILYMYNPAGMPAPAKPMLATSRPVPGASTYPGRTCVGEIDIYLGLIPAQNLLALPKGSAERTMHGGYRRVRAIITSMSRFLMKRPEHQLVTHKFKCS